MLNNNSFLKKNNKEYLFYYNNEYISFNDLFHSDCNKSELYLNKLLTLVNSNNIQNIKNLCYWILNNNKVLNFALFNNNSSIIIQKCYNSLSVKNQELIINQINYNLNNLIKSKHGIFLIKSIFIGIHKIPNFIISELKKFTSENKNYNYNYISGVISLAIDNYGSRILEILIIRFSSEQWMIEFINELAINCKFLVNDNYGNYIIQLLIDNNLCKTYIINQILDSFNIIIKSKSGSHIIENLINNADEDHTFIILNKLNNINIIELKSIILNKFSLYALVKLIKTPGKINTQTCFNTEVDNLQKNLVIKIISIDNIKNECSNIINIGYQRKLEELFYLMNINYLI